MNTLLKILLFSKKNSDIDIFRKSINEFKDKMNIKSCKVEVCKDSETFFEYTIKGHNFYDIYFIDYDDNDVFSLTKTMSAVEVGRPVVLISSKPVLKSCAYYINLFDYLFRPIDSSTLLRLLTHFYLNFVLPDKMLFIKNSNHFYIQSDNIICLETYNRGIKIYTADVSYLEKLITQPDLYKDINLNEKSIYYSRRLSEIKDKLDSSIFIQCHQSFIININKAISVKRYCVMLDNGTNTGLSADISKSRYDEVRNSFIHVSGHKSDCKILFDFKLSSVAGGQYNKLDRFNAQEMKL